MTAAIHTQNKPQRVASNRVDLTGFVFGRLTVLEYAYTKNWRAYWKCECGNITIVRADQLKDGTTTSCGCLNLEKHTIHHGSRTRLYNIWYSIKSRCYNKNHIHYKNYGGRGIRICEEWSKFKNFKEWALVNNYNDTLSIDRIDNDKDYSPDNCRWATPKEQSNNRRNNVFYEYNGVKHTIPEWSDITGIKHQTIASRLRMGWSIEDTLLREVKR